MALVTPPGADEGTAALLGTFVPNVCHVCKRAARPGAPLQACSRCRWVSYCGRECQALDWRRGGSAGHRELCGSLAELRSRVDSAATAEREKRAAAAEQGELPDTPPLFHPTDPATLSRYVRASALVLEDVLGRPYYDDEAVHVLHQRRCAHCFGVAARKPTDWISCAGCSTAVFCSRACCDAGAAAHAAACTTYELLRASAAAVAASLARTARPPLWTPAELPLPAPQPPAVSSWDALLESAVGAAPLCAEPMAAEAPPQHVRRALLTEDLSDPLTVLLALREGGAFGHGGVQCHNQRSLCSTT